jgi:anti-sigma factor RsiW
MNKCMELDIQEMLPDLLHRSLDASATQRVEAHLASCAACTEELEVLRTVRAAAVFAPAIDVTSIVRQIPPYRRIAPANQLPARSRMVSWLVAAGLMVVIAGGGSLLMVQPKSAVPPVAVVDSQAQASGVLPGASQASPGDIGTNVSVTSPTRTLALNAGVDGLSDGDLQQLISDMDNFDALPSAEPEPIITVDNVDTASETR